MAMCSVCGDRPANPKLEGAFGRPVCDECGAVAQIDMEEETLDIEEIK